MSGLFVTDVDAVSIDVSLSVLILGFLLRAALYAITALARSCVLDTAD